MEPRVRPLIAIDYNYNARKVIYFIITDNTGSTQSGLPYLYQYLDNFNIVAIVAVARPVVVSKFFGSVNEVDSHKKSRQYYLALEAFWVTHLGWLRLCTTVAIGMTITFFHKLFRYGVKRDYYEKLISIREFSERLAQDCFNNLFSTDTGTSSNNTPFLV